MGKWLLQWWRAEVDFQGAIGDVKTVRTSVVDDLYMIEIGDHHMGFKLRWWEGKRLLAWRMRRAVKRAGLS